MSISPGPTIFEKSPHLIRHVLLQTRGPNQDNTGSTVLGTFIGADTCHSNSLAQPESALRTRLWLNQLR